ncbi:hypothetical protein JVU11DRAFT_11768 [Chiua virens]|nr:hypothetical protein JVU11DRAFT_11768 [Chiua virens]
MSKTAIGVIKGHLKTKGEVSGANTNVLCQQTTGEQASALSIATHGVASRRSHKATQAGLAVIKATKGNLLSHMQDDGEDKWTKAILSSLILCLFILHMIGFMKSNTGVQFTPWPFSTLIIGTIQLQMLQPILSPTS